MSDRRFDLLTEDDIASGTATAAYFLRTETVLEELGTDPHVVAELSAPSGWHVLSGLKDAAALLEGLPIDVYAPPEGTAINGGPVLRIEGPYRSFARYESPLLGFLSHASGITTAAWQIRAAAGEATVLSFGTRRQHPSLGAMIERSAIIGGADGIGNVAGGEVIGVEAGGTMPHALIVCVGDPESAWQAFDDIMPSDVPRVLLCDTFGDEAAEARAAAALLEDRLESVRLDTTRSRRGDMSAIVDEVRWALDQHGATDVDIMVSGGVDVTAIEALRDGVDAFGVGGAIANADPVDFSLNIVEVDGNPRSKRGVKPGAKAVYRSGTTDTIVSVGQTAPGKKLLEPVITNGTIVQEFQLNAARDRAREYLDKLGADRVLDRQS